MHKNSVSKFMNNKRYSGAFSVIELLIVIGIISLLSAIVYVSLGLVRIKSRDQARMIDLNNIYRFLGAAGGSLAASWPSGVPNDGDLSVLISAWSAQLNTKLFFQPPRDPRAATATDSGYRYIYDNGSLAIYANLEKKDTPPTLPFNQPSPGGGRGVLVGTGAWIQGVNGTDRYFQISN